MMKSVKHTCARLAVGGIRPLKLTTFSRISQRSLVSYATLEVGEDFIQEMKKVSMKLHKMPKDKSTPSFESWEYSREGFLRHLVESRVVYRAFEEIINTIENYARFRDSGLDRVEALDADIPMLASKYGLEIPEASEDGVGTTYAKFLKETASKNEGQFLCHFYNYYLAHTAGGRMIGKKVADTVLDGQFEELSYYKYDSDLKALVTTLKNNVNTFASDLSESERDLCLEETPNAFKNAGAILKTLF